MANPVVYNPGYVGGNWPTYSPDSSSPWSPYYGMPSSPGYTTVFDPDTMSMADQIQSRLNGINLNTQGLDAFRQQALRKGPSTWANLMNQKQYAEEGDQREQAKNEAASSQAQAEADLAMHGGLSSGARERLATSGARNLLSMSQDVGRQGSLNRMQIGINDEQNRISQLGMLPGMEVQALQPDLQKEQMWEQAKQTDLQRVQAENDRRNQWNQNLYNQQMQSWAANRQAQATENAGKK